MIKKFQSKWIILMMALVLSIGLITTGCSNNNKVNSNTSTPNTDTTDRQKSEPVTISWWSWDPETENAKTYIDAFEASHRDIKVEYKKFDYNDYIKTLKLSIASGEGPDVLSLQAGSFLNEYKSFTMDLAPLAAEAWGGDWLQRFVSAGMYGIEDNAKYNALPFTISAAGMMWYNKDLFDKAGVTVPATYTEWLDVTQKLKSQGITPFIHGAKDNWVNFDTFITLSNEYAPGKFYQAENGEVSWTDPDLVKAMTAWKQLFDDGIMQKGAVGISEYPDANDAFVKGQAAMIMLGGWNADRMTNFTMNNFKTSFGLDSVPTILPMAFPDMNGDGKSASLIASPGSAISINKSSKHQEQAWEFVKFLMSDEGQKIVGSKLQSPTVKGIDMIDTDVITDEQKAALKKITQDITNNVAGKRDLTYPELSTVLGDALQLVATGQASPEKAMMKVEAASKSLQR